MLKTWPVDAVGATEAGVIKKQNDVIVTALLQRVVNMFATSGCWLAQQWTSIWEESQLNDLHETALDPLHSPFPPSSLCGPFLPIVTAEYRSARTRIAAEKMKGRKDDAQGAASRPG